MQVQKGLVKYKDRSDILCTYGITEDGKTYYFLEGNAISNGNIVATTVLVEAIDPLVVSSSIGVIDPEGNVIIPFENKAIKIITDDLLLVEKSVPVSESVVEAVSLRGDAQAASKLVSTPAVIKETINAKMGSEGRFVFNDQFSEATICDINGQNLINDELFSFIGVNADKIYLSKNIPNSFVSEFDIASKQLVLTPDMKQDEITEEIKEEVIEETNTPIEETEVSTEVVADSNEEEKEVVSQEEVNIEEGFSPEDIGDIQLPDFENVSEESSEASTEAETEAVMENVQGTVEEPAEVSTEVVEDTMAESTEIVDEIVFDVNLDLEESTEDIFADVKLKEDKIVADEKDDTFDDTYFPEHSSKSDSLVHEVTATVNELVEVNREQRKRIAVYEERLEQMAETNRRLNEKLREQSRDYEKLRNTAENFRTVVGKLEAKCGILEGKNETLESKVSDQERTILRLSSENNSLRQENLNNEELAQVLAEARSALGGEDVGYYRKAA